MVKLDFRVSKPCDAMNPHPVAPLNAATGKGGESASLQSMLNQYLKAFWAMFFRVSPEHIFWVDNPLFHVFPGRNRFEFSRTATLNSDAAHHKRGIVS